jgi:tetratricopeptide (TPR) repeat protein
MEWEFSDNDGYKHFNIGNVYDAIESLNKYIEHNNKCNSIAYINRAIAYAAIGNSNAAEDDLQKACELDPMLDKKTIEPHLTPFGPTNFPSDGYI